LRIPEDGEGGQVLSQLDEIDRGIIAALQVDGRRPYSRMSADLGVSESVIRYRVQRLEQADILQVVGIANPLRIGFDLMALVGVHCRGGTVNEVADAISKLPEPSYVAVTAGRFDLFVEVICRDTAHFHEFLTENLTHIDGVERCESFLVLDIKKLAYGWGVGRNGTESR
jgi:Lrp/AsnC family transcriptional regulator, regulator for asnA, asnC and gidA